MHAVLPLIWFAMYEANVFCLFFLNFISDLALFILFFIFALDERLPVHRVCNSTLSDGICNSFLHFVSGSWVKRSRWMLASWLSFAHHTMLDLTNKDVENTKCWSLTLDKTDVKEEALWSGFSTGFLFCDHNIHAFKRKKEQTKKNQQKKSSSCLTKGRS